MNTKKKIVYVVRNGGGRIDLREVAFDLAALPLMYATANCVVAGAHRDGSVVAAAIVHEDVDLEEALDVCLGALVDTGADAAVAYSPLHGPGSPVGMLERHALFGLGRCLAADQGIHLVDWLLCGDGTYHCLKPVPDNPSDWWDVPETRLNDPKSGWHRPNSRNLRCSTCPALTSSGAWHRSCIATDYGLSGNRVTSDRADRRISAAAPKGRAGTLQSGVSFCYGVAS